MRVCKWGRGVPKASKAWDLKVGQNPLLIVGAKAFKAWPRTRQSARASTRKAEGPPCGSKGAGACGLPSMSVALRAVKARFFTKKQPARRRRPIAIMARNHVLISQLRWLHTLMVPLGFKAIEPAALHHACHSHAVLRDLAVAGATRGAAPRPLGALPIARAPRRLASTRMGTRGSHRLDLAYSTAYAAAVAAMVWV